MKQQMCKITIQGTEREYPRETTFQQIADEYQSQMENDIVLVKFPAGSAGAASVGTQGRRTGIYHHCRKTGQRYLPEKCDASDGGSGMEAVSEPGASCPAFHWSGYYCEFRHADAICVPDQKMLQALKEKMTGIVEADLPIVK